MSCTPIDTIREQYKKMLPDLQKLNKYRSLKESESISGEKLDRVNNAISSIQTQILTQSEEIVDQIATMYNTLTKSDILTIQQMAQRLDLVKIPGYKYQTPFMLNDALQAKYTGEEYVERKDTNARTLEKADPATQRQNASTNYLFKAFGSAIIQREKVKQQLSVDLANAVICNRDPEFIGERKITTNNVELNDNLRKLQEKYFQQIISYLKTIDHTGFESDLKTIQSVKTIYNSHGEYTGDFDKIKILAEKFLDSSTKSPDDIKNMDESTLQAYTAYQHLTHFDSMLVSKYGKEIIITKGRFADGQLDKEYGFNTKGSSNATNWTNQDTISIEDSVNKITQELIKSTPLYLYGEGELTGQYVSFNQALDAITAIKGLAFQNNILFENNILEQMQKLGVSQETQSFIKNKSLHTVIAEIRENPQEALRALFDIFSHVSKNHGVMNQFSSKAINYFNDSQRNTIYSLNRGFFSESDNTSLFSINKKNIDEKNLYFYICQSFDTVSRVNFAQYYVEEGGNVNVRNLQNSMEGLYLSRAKRTISTTNSTLIGNWTSSEVADGQMTLNHNKISSELLSNLKLDFKNQSNKYFAFTLFDQYRIRINTKHDDPESTMQFIRLSDKSSMQLNQFNNLGESKKDFDEKLFQLMNQILGFKFDNENQLKEVSNWRSQTIRLIASIIKNIAINQHLHNQGYNTPKSLKSNVETFGLNKRIKIYRTNDIDFVDKSVSIFLSQLAICHARVHGQLSNTSIKNGEGNTQSAITTSRLNDNVRTQIQLQCSKASAATLNLDFVRNSKIFNQLYTAKEFVYNSGEVVDHTKFSVAEYTTSAFLYNYILGLQRNTGDSDVIGDGKIGFFPSVNSDKTTINLLTIDANQKVTVAYNPIELAQVKVDLNGKPVLDPTYQSNDIRYQMNINSENIYKLLDDEEASISYLVDNHLISQFSNLDDIRIKLKSDKSRRDIHDLIAQNLHQYNNTAYISSEQKEIKNLSTNEIYNYTARQLGNVYKRSAETIDRDIKTLINFWNENCPNNLQIKLNENVNVVFDNFNDLNNKIIALNRSPLETIRQLCARYNLEHPKNPISLIEETYFLSAPILNGDNTKSGYTGLIANPTLIEYLYRYNQLPEEYVNKHRGLITNEEFHSMKSKEVLTDCVEAGFEINFGSEDSEVLTYLKQQLGPEWISSNYNSMIIGKITNQNGEVFNITSKNDHYNLTNLIDKSVKVELNPLIEKYNALHECFTQQYMLCTVGSAMNHPSKGLNKSLKKGIKMDLLSQSYQPIEQYNRITEEADRFNAQHKRNVSNTASMKELSLNHVDGVVSRYKAVAIEDVFDTQYNVFGDEENGVKPYDGAMWVDGVSVYEENVSLGGDRAGFTKKLFAHSYDSDTATGKIFKTCGFAIMNNSLRNQPRLRNMLKKMYDLSFDNLGSSIVDITKDYYGNDIGLAHDTCNSQWKLEPIIFKHKSTYYEISKIESLGNNKYNIIGHVLNTESNDLGSVEIVGQSNNDVVINNIFSEQNLLDSNGNVVINTNWALYHVLGAWNTVERRGTELVPSESSFRNLTILNSKVGKKLNNKPVVEVQNDVWQPLKHARINWIATAGVLKQGAGNMNSRNNYDNNTPFNWFEFDMHQVGVQLDKEHHADNSELSLMTQVISACSHLGFTSDRAQNLYKSLAILAKQETREIMDPTLSSISKTNEDDIDRCRVAVIQMVVESLANGEETENNLITSIASKLIEKIRNNEELTLEHAEEFPIDDPSVYHQFVKEIVVYMNKGIKLKIPGQLNVLTPSYDLFKIYDNRTYSEIENNEFGLSAEEYLQKLFDEQPDMANNGIINWSNLIIGRHYVINGEEVPCLTPKQYQAIRTKYSGQKILSCKEDIRKGRNLSNYNVRFKSIDGTDYQMYDLDSVQALFALKDVKDWEGLNKWATIYASQDVYNRFPDLLKNETSYTIEQYVDNLAQYFRKQVRSDLAALSVYGKYVSGFNENREVSIRGQHVSIDVKSVQVDPYECIIPKRVKEPFGLEDYTPLSNINKEYFKTFLNNNFRCTPNMDHNNFSIELKRSNGKHIHLLMSDKLESSKNLTSVTYHTEIIHGKLYRINSDGEPMYQIGKDDLIYIDENGNEVIVYKDPAFYIRNIEFNTLALSDELNEQEQNNIKQKITKSLKKNRYISNWGKNYSKERNDQLLYGPEALPENDPERIRLETKANDLFQTFKRSLDVVASRTPSQSMQSFMAMKVVAFDGLNLNNIYVSTGQIWLQGSDYDVDAASVAQYDIDNNGNLPVWSPYVRFDTDKNTDISLNMPFPLGQIQQFDITDIESLNNALNSYNQIESTIYNSFDRIDIEEIYNAANTNNYNLDVIQRVLNLYQDTKFINIDQIPDELRPVYDEWIEQHKNTSELINNIKTICDTHNVFLTKKSDQYQNSAVKNYAMHEMYNIIRDPVNQGQAQQSVDSVTGEAKEQADTAKHKSIKLKRATTGNFINQFEAAIANAVGKDGIGICAVSLKSFFALSAYYNEQLKRGDVESCRRLIFRGKSGQGLDFNFENGKKHVEMLANVLTVPTDDPYVQKALETVNQNKDAALLLSGLLSLSTDNAKELKLDKLNANSAMISLYLYGITIGLSVKDVGSLLMSPLGNRIANLLQSNKFVNKKGFTSLDSIFKYIDGSIGSIYSNIDYQTWRNLKSASIQKSERDPIVTRVIKNFAENLSKTAESIYTTDSAESREQIKSMFIEKKNYLQTIDNKLANNTNNVFAQEARRVIRDLENYLYFLYDNIYSSKKTYDQYQTFKQLANGANELRTLGQMLGLNQGFAPQEFEVLEKVKLFEDVLTFQNDGEDNVHKISLIDFAFKDNERQYAIEQYEKKRHTFNILECVTAVPQFQAYIQQLAATHMNLLQSSARYNFIAKNINDVVDHYNLISKKDRRRAITGMGNYITDQIRDEFFKQLDVKSSKPGVIEDVNNLNVLVSGHNIGSVNKGQIILGTPDGNATFKKHFESLINQLQKNYPDNEFIQNLTFGTSDKNPAHQTILQLQLPCNMMPRTEEDSLELGRYRDSFNQLSTKTLKIGSSELPITDWFYIYSLITYGGKVSQESLIGIFANLQNLSTGVINQHKQFEAKFTKDYLSKFGEYNSHIQLNFNELEPYLFSTDMNENNIQGRNVAYIFDKDTGNVIRKRRTIDDNGLQKWNDGEQLFNRIASAKDSYVNLPEDNSLVPVQFTENNTEYHFNLNSDNKLVGEIFRIKTIEGNPILDVLQITNDLKLGKYNPQTQTYVFDTTERGIIEELFNQKDCH